MCRILCLEAETGTYILFDVSDQPEARRPSTDGVDCRRSWRFTNLSLVWPGLWCSDWLLLVSRWRAQRHRPVRSTLRHFSKSTSWCDLRTIKKSQHRAKGAAVCTHVSEKLPTSARWQGKHSQKDVCLEISSKVSPTPCFAISSVHKGSRQFWGKNKIIADDWWAHLLNSIIWYLKKEGVWNSFLVQSTESLFENLGRSSFHTWTEILW